MLALLALGGLAACGGGDDGGAAVTPTVGTPFVADSVRSALEYGVSNGLEGIWVYVDAGDGAPLWAAAGIEDRASLAPARTGSLFKIASISKMFVAVSSVRAVSQGLVRLDDTLAFWLPEIAPRIDNAGAITLRHLLLHRSGVRDFDTEPGFSWTRSHTDVDRLLEYAYDKPGDFEPGARYAYSNTNYVLAARILDTALGYSHHDYVRNEITAPLGMLDTYSLLGDVDVALLARGYWDGVDRTTQDYVAPGGSMVSTARDVGVFLRALADGTLLTGPEQSLYRSLFDIGHSGWLPGYQSLAYYHRDSDTVLVQLVNETGGNSEAVAQQVYDSIAAYLRAR